MHLNSSIDKKMTTLNILFKTTSLCLAMALLVGCNDNDDNDSSTPAPRSNQTVNILEIMSLTVVQMNCVVYKMAVVNNIPALPHAKLIKTLAAQNSISLQLTWQ